MHWRLGLKSAGKAAEDMAERQLAVGLPFGEIIHRGSGVKILQITVMGEGPGFTPQSAGERMGVLRRDISHCRLAYMRHHSGGARFGLQQLRGPMATVGSADMSLQFQLTIAK